MSYNLKVGLEIHVYPKMSNKTKLFCNCKIDLNAKPNSNICEVCTSQPGANPMLPNSEAFFKTVALALSFNCKVNSKIAFQRKHYSWPDLPSGYQRTMSGSYSFPVGINGVFENIRINELHLEEDPARWNPETGEVDYNRSGIPLIEIVTEPDFKSSEEVKVWLKKLKIHLNHLGCFDENFGIKADVNVSISPEFERVEIKNINSFSSIVEAIEFEYKRQIEEKKKGNVIPQQTRTWTGSETVMMRLKESNVDYKFIPEQDLPVIIVDNNILSEAEKFVVDYKKLYSKLLETNISKEDADIIIEHPVVCNYAFFMLKNNLPGKFVGNFLRNQFLRVVNYNQVHPSFFKGSKNNVLKTAKLFFENKISDKIAKNLMEKLFEEDFDVEKFVFENNLLVISDNSLIEDAVLEVLKEQQKAVEDYKNGKVEVINFLSGQVMRKTKGKADIKKVKKMLEEKLK